MAYNKSYETTYQTESGKVVSSSMDTTARLMRNVYVWMTLALVITGFTSLLVAGSNLWQILVASPLIWILCIAEIGIVWYMSARIQSISFGTAGVLFAVYSLLNGVNLSTLCLLYTTESLTQTFFITAGTFGGMALVGSLTKHDLSAIGRICFMALIGLIIATVVNIFWMNSGLMMICNYAGVLIFTGLTAYDSQKIKNMMTEASSCGYNDDTNKYALMGSLALYLDFVNLFIYLVQLFGKRK